MGASGNAASKSDLAALQSTVKGLQTKVKALENTSVDDKAIQNVVKNLDYLKLKNELSMGDLSTEVLKNPGAIAESVAQSFTTNTGRMAPIATALADNEKFAKTLADTLTDTSGKYRSALRGDKGETGDLAASKDTVKAALYDKKYTMWCADGDYCVLPVGSKGIKLGQWHFEQHQNGNLHVHQGNLDDWSVAVTPKRLHTQEGMHIHNGQLHLPDAWTIGQNGSGDYLRFNKHGDVKGAVHESGGYWGRNYGDKFLHDWARESFVRKDKTYELRDQNEQGRHCIDAGSNGRGCDWNNKWQRFSIVETPHNRND